jgi:hypothetical protein
MLAAKEIEVNAIHKNKANSRCFIFIPPCDRISFVKTKPPRTLRNYSLP